jgi:hypothetical protein
MGSFAGRQTRTAAPKWGEVGIPESRCRVPLCVAMPDYYPLISRAVSRLESNTPAARHDVFERARVILIHQLRIRQPLASDSETTRERAALEEAIQKVEAESARLAIMHAGSASAPRNKSTERNPPFRVSEPSRVANSRQRGPTTFGVRRDAPIELNKTSDNHRGYPTVTVGGLHGRPAPTLFERTQVTLIDQPRIQQPTVSDSEITRGRATFQDAARKLVSEPNTTAARHAVSAPVLSAMDGGHVNSGIFEQRAPDDQPSGSATFAKEERPANELTETASASILSNLRGMHWLNQLIVDGSSPLAPDSLRQDARVVRKWLSIGETEAIKTKHYDQFGRAIQRYMTQERLPPSSAQTPTTAQLPDLALNDDIRDVFNRLLDREQAAIIFDNALTWFAKIWIVFVVVLNLFCIVGLVASAPTLWVGVGKLSGIYSPLSIWNWVAEVVALSPALGAIAWRDRRQKHPVGAGLLTFEFPTLGRLTRVKRGAVNLRQGNNQSHPYRA